MHEKINLRMLVGRVTELERRLAGSSKTVNNNETEMKTNITLASASLMEGYTQPSGLHFSDKLESTELIAKFEKELKLKSIKLAEDSSEPNEENISTQQIDGENVAHENNRISNFNDKNVPNREEKSVHNDDTLLTDREEKCLPNDGCDNDVQSESVKQELSSHSESDFEEVVPLENIDTYIYNLKQKRTKQENHESLLEKSVAHQGEQWLGSPFKLNGKSNLSVEVETSDDISSENSSFNIDLSDYDSDDDNFQETLQNWQSEFEKNACSKLVKSLSPKKSKMSKKIWKGENLKVGDDFEEMLKK